ncbi:MULTISPECIES: phage tail protein [unclassified Vibrio]|uniref:phage tail protein n=1 Tax=unclassified Vibrio TaxID=2614977 RepID=UPI001361427C|nr:MULTISPECIES: phage tail protein [unclassified Vibrio]NAW59489.1 phage tail protein [Vibrio sp. V36_P2S2PM302]NAX25446.1 phage tail protein [Vibrio sp. V38_P2S17PM301]NAX30372.1 phage tail protein [Vibrio sp. V37_P2S8PM304]
MKSLQSLTELFKAHIIDASQLSVWAEDGALFCGQSQFVDGFEVEYTAIVFIQNATVAPHVLMLHLVNWLNRYDPHRQEKGLAMPSFALEHLGDGKFDIKIKLDLQEAFTLQACERGDWMQGDTRYDCVSEFSATVDEDDLDVLVYAVGHLEDLPCQR